jgi:hypothetical protein
MTPIMIEKAQECLTIKEGKHLKKVVDISSLLNKHGTDMVLDFLNRLFSEYEETLKKLVVTNKTSPEIDKTVSKLFRLHMAIRTIQRNDEEVIAA